MESYLIYGSGTVGDIRQYGLMATKKEIVIIKEGVTNE